MRGIWKILAVLAAVWLVAGGIILWSRASRPTPESLTSYVVSHPIDHQSPQERQKTIRSVASQLNRLTYDQRRALRRDGIEKGFFEKLTPDEQNQFLDLTLPEGFRQLMIALNNMDPERRKRIVQRTLDDIARESPQGTERLDQQQSQKLISEGLESFYKDANATVKLEFAPVIEELQRATQNLR